MASAGTTDPQQALVTAAAATLVTSRPAKESLSALAAHIIPGIRRGVKSFFPPFFPPERSQGRCLPTSGRVR